METQYETQEHVIATQHLYRLHHDVGPKSIIDEVVEEIPNNFAEENAAMTSFKRPASLKPMIPICVYIIRVPDQITPSSALLRFVFAR
jgi:hypothetical protein